MCKERFTAIRHKCGDTNKTGGGGVGPSPVRAGQVVEVSAGASERARRSAQESFFLVSRFGVVLLTQEHTAHNLTEGGAGEGGDVRVAVRSSRSQPVQAPRPFVAAYDASRPYAAQQGSLCYTGRWYLLSVCCSYTTLRVFRCVCQMWSTQKCQPALAPQGGGLHLRSHSESK